MQLAGKRPAMPVAYAMDLSPRPPAGKPYAAFAAALACWAAVAAVAWWQASGASAGFDRAGLLLWREAPSLLPIGPAWLTSLMQGLTTVGGGIFRFALGLAVLIVLVARRHTSQTLMLLALMLAPPLINSELKALFARPRPDLVPYFDTFNDPSFPSGHSFNAAATYIGLALILASLRPGLRAPLIAAGVLLSLAIAFSRVWLGVHWPTDAVAGWLGGTGWALMMGAAIRPKPGPG